MAFGYWRVSPHLLELEGDGGVIISSPFVWKLSPETASDLAGVTQLFGQSRSCRWVVVLAVTYPAKPVLTGQLCGRHGSLRGSQWEDRLRVRKAQPGPASPLGKVPWLSRGV